MNRWTWREGLAFAFARKLIPAKEEDLIYEMNFGEKWGSQILKPLHQLIEFISKNIRIPLAICLITILAALILGVVFYNIPLFIFLGKIFPALLVRFLLFIYIELNLFAMGSVAFGRFHNQALTNLWKSGRLVAVMPGDYEVWK